MLSQGFFFLALLSLHCLRTCAERCLIRRCLFPQVFYVFIALFFRSPINFAADTHSSCSNETASVGAISGAEKCEANGIFKVLSLPPKFPGFILGVYGRKFLSFVMFQQDF